MMNIVAGDFSKGLDPDAVSLAFLRRVLPPEGAGLYCAFLRERKAHKFASSIEALWRTVSEHDRSGGTSYFGVAAFRGRSRTANSAVALRSLFLDIDVGAEKALAGKGYATTQEAGDAVRRFAHLLQLPPPWVVASGGGGFHCYWVLQEALPVELWLQYASGLKRLCATHGLLADPSVTADAARILRVPGTHNRKDPRAPKLVVFDQRQLNLAPCKIEQFSKCLDGGYRPSLKNIAALVAPTYPEAHAGPIAEQCAQVRRFRDLQGVMPEPEWKACLGVLARCKDGEKFGHEWSKGDVRYDPAETQSKIDASRKNTTGATTCAHFESLNPKACGECKFKGVIASPIRLGEASFNSGEPAQLPSADKNIAEMNERHFVVTIGGKTLVGGLDGGLKLATFQDFRNRYCNQIVPVADGSGEGKMKRLGDYWLNHRERRQYNGMDIVPDGPRDLPDGALNLWTGWGRQPLKGDWSLMREHVVSVLAAGDSHAAEYILRWSAWVVQNPGARAEVILALRGGKGCGKGIFIGALSKCFGRHAQEIRNSAHLVGRFNGHLQDCLFMFLDEGYWAGDKQGEATLKGFVTEPTFTLERKGVDAIPWRNRLSIALAGNSEWVVPATEGERRYAVFEASDAYVRGRCDPDVRESYFKRLHNEQNNGGIEAMLHDLLKLDLGDWHPRQIYETAALLAQKALTLGPYEEWWVDLLQEGRLPGLRSLQAPKDFATNQALLEDAVRSAPRRRYFSKEGLGRFLSKRGCTQGKDRAGFSELRGWSFPPLHAARRTWAGLYGGWQWRHPDQTDWE